MGKDVPPFWKLWESKFEMNSATFREHSIEFCKEELKGRGRSSEPPKNVLDI